MDELRKKVRQELKNRPRIDWSDTKPPTEHAVYPMIRNLHAAGKKQRKNSEKSGN